MREPSESISIAERLARKKRKHTPLPPARAAAEPAPPSLPRMVMTVEEMGKELGISRATAYELARQKVFPSFAIGRRVLVSRDGLQKWIEQQYSSKESEHDKIIGA